MNVWAPFAQMKGYSPKGEVIKASGAWLELSDGRRVMDGISSWWVNNHGHNHPVIMAAITEQLSRYDQVILADFSHGQSAQLAQRLAEVLPGDLQHVHYSDNGSTAVEIAMKMAFQSQANLGQGQRKRFVAFTGAYHGDTIGAMSLGERGPFNEHFWDLMFDVDFLTYGAIDEVRAYLSEHGDEVAAVILEPLVQGAAGMKFCSPEFLAQLRELTEEAGCWLIADEVMTGFGRTGTVFAVEQAGIVPDIICLSKGITGGCLPISVTVTRPAVFEAFLGPDKRSAFLHGHSYTGNPIACAAANAAFTLFESEDTLGRVAMMERVYRSVVSDFEALPSVVNVRARGGIFAFEIEQGQAGYHNPVGGQVTDRCFAKGLYLRPLGNTVYLMPPFCVSEEELRAALEVLRCSVADVVGEEADAH